MAVIDNILGYWKLDGNSNDVLGVLNNNERIQLYNNGLGRPYPFKDEGFSNGLPHVSVGNGMSRNEGAT